MLEKGKNRKNKKKERGEIESAGIPLKVVVKVVRLVPEEKKRGLDKEVGYDASIGKWRGRGDVVGRFVDVEGKVSRYVNRIKVDVENMLGSQTEPYIYTVDLFHPVLMRDLYFIFSWP